MRGVKVYATENRVEETMALIRKRLGELAGMFVGLSYTVM